VLTIVRWDDNIVLAPDTEVLKRSSGKLGRWSW